MDESRPQPRLIQADGKEILITDQMTIGRSPECTVPVEDSRVSRRHAMLNLVDQKVVISDLGSHNGTWVNDQKITVPTELNDGDRVRISKVNFVFRINTVGQPTAAKSVEPSGEKKEKSTTSFWKIADPLTLVRGDGAEFGLNHNVTIGRDKTNDLPLTRDSNASQFHTQIELIEGRVVISDLGSRNGTWVNGRRITGKRGLNHGDKIRAGDTVFRMRVGDRPLPPLDPAAQPARPAKVSWLRWGLPLIGSAAGLMLLVIVLVIALWPRTPEPDGEEIQQAAVQQALHSLVYVRVPVTGGYFSGSGSMLSAQGYVLTNYHVVVNNEGRILIGLNWTNPEAAPDTFYLCELVDFDQHFDLALLHVVAAVDGGTVPAFTPITVGDSDELVSMDPIFIIGYPELGGETPTATAGVVSGFEFFSDGRKEWIKTDADINSGNSGGMAIDQSGKLIGVPTKALATTATAEAKGYIPGKISEVRPINLALDLIEAYVIDLNR